MIKMKTITVLGIDPSLRNFGYALAELDLHTLEFEVQQLKLVTTEATKVKTARKNSDDLDRCRAQYQALKEMEKKAKIAFVEMPVGSQSARAMMSYGACMALIGALDIPVIQVTPNEVKIAAVGDKLATKAEMIRWATATHPHEDWLKSGARYTNANEHLADAVGAIKAGVAGDEFAALMLMMMRIVA